MESTAKTPASQSALLLFIAGLWRVIIVYLQFLSFICSAEAGETFLQMVVKKRSLT